MLKQVVMDSRSDLNKKLNIAHINMCTTAEGPYKRMAIWFQGCNILCKGCCNPELQPIKPTHVMTISEIVNIAVNSRNKYGIEGVTFLGGEPTLQAYLYILSHELKKKDFGIILFTGKLLYQLSLDLVNNLDIVIDGEFQLDKMETERNLIGSKNQRIHLISNRYSKDVSWFNDVRAKIVEMNFGDREFFVSGDVIL